MMCSQRRLHPVTWLFLSAGYMKACDFWGVSFLSIESYDAVLV